MERKLLVSIIGNSNEKENQNIIDKKQKVAKDEI